MTMRDTNLPHPWLTPLVLVALTVLAYVPAISNGVIWDDGKYLFNNHLMPRLNGPGWFWWSIDETPTHWYPMALTSLWLEYRLWGSWPLPYHVTNILLHAVNVLLVWRLARRLNLRAPFAVAAVFALHPLAVESVAWIAERKNLLAMCFSLASILLYLRFAGVHGDLPAEDPARPRWRLYAMSLLTFFLALASKAACCGLPAAILVLLWMRRRLTWKDAAAMAPFVAIAVAVAALSAYVEHHKAGIVGSAFAFTAAQRAMIAGMNVAFYLGKFLFPYPLIATYMRWDIAHPPLVAYVLPAAIPLALLLLFLLHRRIGRGPAAGFAIFLLAVGPALGLVTFYSMAFSFAADHYVYFALPALGAMAVAPAARLVRSAAPTVPRIVLPAVLGALVALTLFQSSLYARGTKLWQYTIAHAPGNWMARRNFANALMVEHRYTEALPHAFVAATLNPGDPDVHLELALALSKNGRTHEALRHAEESLRLSPRSIAAIILVSELRGELEKPTAP